MTIAWDKIFDSYGVKTVKKTDKDKGAYVLNAEQRAVIDSAGVLPKQGVFFDVTVLFDPATNAVKSSYYHSVRSSAAHRAPEPRMGGPFISRWLDIGDEIVIGSIGGQVFAAKTKGSPISDTAVISELAKRANRQAVFSRANKATGKPARRMLEKEDFVRDPFVVRAALLRSLGKCEMPGCTCNLFLKDDGSPYLEVHHVLPLGEGGHDSLLNAAALCPHCHRELHSGKDRAALRITLATQIALLLA